jgi:serine/threonine protein kinase
MLDASASLWEDVMSRLRQATTGEFQILDELGRGGMAAVYLAHDLALNRRVAIKVMAPGLLLGPGMVERFRQEAITVANLNHPHIVTIHAVRQAAGLHYFVMKLIPGASVERIIREVRPLSIPVVQALVHQIAGALQYAHRRGVIHRDVKPSNILLDDDGNAVVTDFGIAKVVESPSHTQTGATIGTPAYMSPEQCWSREVTAASDQYSLGIVVYEMLTGKPPFPVPLWRSCGPTPRSLLHRYSTRDPSAHLTSRKRCTGCSTRRPRRAGRRCYVRPRPWDAASPTTTTRFETICSGCPNSAPTTRFRRSTHPTARSRCALDRIRRSRRHRRKSRKSPSRFASGLLRRPRRRSPDLRNRLCRNHNRWLATGGASRSSGGWCRRPR